MILSKTFQIESAHFLPNVPPGHKCGRIHGHSFKITVQIKGPVDEKMGWVMDFADVKAVYKPIFEQLDHRMLNDIEGLENPTSEILAVWLWKKLKPQLPLLYKIKVAETCTSACEYKGD